MTSVLATSWQRFRTRWSAIEELAPRYFIGFFLAFLAIQFILMIVAPPNDFDTLSSYIARIHLERFGPLKDTATLEIQYLFPKFFDYLHRPFLELGAFYSLPNFTLFIVTLYIIIAYFPPRVALISLCLIMACQPLLITITGLKNDISIALFGFIAWFLIAYRQNSSWYFATSVLALCALAGTKWHGLVVIALLVPILVFRIGTTHRLTASAVFIAFLALPAFVYVSSASDYLANYVQYGTPIPRLAYLQVLAPRSVLDVVKSVYGVFAQGVVDTFDIPFYLIDYYWTNGKLWNFAYAVTLGQKIWGYTTAPNSHYTAYGLPILLVIAGSCVALRSRAYPPAIRIAAALALGFLALNLCLFYYTNAVQRYFLFTYVIGILPCAYVLANFYETGKLKSWHRTGRLAALALMYVISLQSLLLNRERLMVDFTLVNYTDQTSYRLPSMLRSIGTPDKMYFAMWGGYWEIYQYQQSNILPSDGLFFLNNAQGGEVPFIYPFIMNRPAANTRVASTRSGAAWNPALCDEFRYVMVYKGSIDDSRYELVFTYPGPLEMKIYRRRAGCV